jgi:hypothetical protein
VFLLACKEGNHAVLQAAGDMEVHWLGGAVEKEYLAHLRWLVGQINSDSN